MSQASIREGGAARVTQAASGKPTPACPAGVWLCAGSWLLQHHRQEPGSLRDECQGATWQGGFPGWLWPQFSEASLPALVVQEDVQWPLPGLTSQAVLVCLVLPPSPADPGATQKMSVKTLSMNSSEGCILSLKFIV